MQPYSLISGIIFGLVALLQIIRAVNQWPVQISSFAAPIWLSWVVAAITGALCVWAFRSRT